MRDDVVLNSIVKIPCMGKISGDEKRYMIPLIVPRVVW